MDIESISYAPWQDAIYGGGGRLATTPQYDETHHICVRIQPFRAGGYEATCSWIDLQRIADNSERIHARGKRIAPEERSISSIMASRQRTKKIVRQRVKDMGGNRLCTLTVRQNDNLGCMSRDDWAAAFARFIRLCRKSGMLDEYVAVLEAHKTGLERLETLARLRDMERRLKNERISVRRVPYEEYAKALDDLARLEAACEELRAAVHYSEDDIPYHLHFVTRSTTKMPVNLLRKLWSVASGRDGNIDVKWFGHGRGDDAAISRVATYVCKYITKDIHFSERFNKKRYWAAGDALMPRRIIWMRSRSINEALREFIEVMTLSGEELSEMIKKNLIFFFPDASGFWINKRPSEHSPPPPF
jgi:hypothetical protein